MADCNRPVAGCADTATIIFETREGFIDLRHLASVPPGDMVGEDLLFLRWHNSAHSVSVSTRRLSKKRWPKVFSTSMRRFVAGL
jgi:hypothetical protein